MMSDDLYQRLGLTSLQADVLITLLELGGEATAPQIIETLSKSQSVNRTSVYSVLTKLEHEGLVRSGSERSSNYTLVTTSPDALIDLLLKPQQDQINLFKNKLKEAKARQNRPQEYEFYYLKSKNQIIEQLELLLKNSSEYILIMANALMLKFIESDLNLITNLSDKKELTVMIIPTWNPDPNLDFDKLLEKLKSSFGSDHVSDPIPIFDRIVPIMQQLITSYPEHFQSYLGSTHFIQVLTKEELLMATYIEDDFQMASGIYSKEPTILQMLHIVFVSLIENLSNISTEKIDEIIRKKTEKTFQAISSFHNKG